MSIIIGWQDVNMETYRHIWSAAMTIANEDLLVTVGSLSWSVPGVFIDGVIILHHMHSLWSNINYSVNCAPY